jgi:rare lipoprotein A
MKHIVLLFLVLLFSGFCQAQQYWEAGTCSYYADRVQGRHTASGERYDKYLLTAAHRTLPFNSLVRVTNLKNNKNVVVRIIDRGPYTKDRIMDLSKAAARELGMLGYGVTWVTIESVGMADADSVNAFLEQRKKEAAERKKLKTQPKQKIEKQVDVLTTGSFYNQDLVVCNPMGYGIQVGYYGNLINCRSDMHTYQSAYNTSVFMYVGVKNKSKYYRLIMGQFASKESAMNLYQMIIKDFPHSFIVKYSSM